MVKVKKKAHLDSILAPLQFEEFQQWLKQFQVKVIASHGQLYICRDTLVTIGILIIWVRREGAEHMLRSRSNAIRYPSLWSARSWSNPSKYLLLNGQIALGTLFSTSNTADVSLMSSNCVCTSSAFSSVTSLSNMAISKCSCTSAIHMSESWESCNDSENSPCGY